MSWNKLRKMSYFRPFTNVIYNSEVDIGIDILLFENAIRSSHYLAGQLSGIHMTNSFFLRIGFEKSFYREYYAAKIGIAYQPFYFKKPAILQKNYRTKYLGSPILEINYLPIRSSSIHADVIRPEIGFMFPVFHKDIPGWIPLWIIDLKINYGYNAFIGSNDSQATTSHTITTGLLLSIRDVRD